MVIVMEAQSKRGRIAKHQGDADQPKPADRICPLVGSVEGCRPASRMGSPLYMKA